MKAEDYIYFERLVSASKTELWAVMNRSYELEIGLIKWYGPWHQYAFFPGDGSCWNPDCLDYVNAKIRELMRARIT